jgi:hypothetical protein
MTQGNTVAIVKSAALIAYQLTVTRRGKNPRKPGAVLPNEWESRNPWFNGQKRSKISAVAIDTMAAEIWLRGKLVNGAKALTLEAGCQGIHDFDRLFALPSRRDWASVRGRMTLPETLLQDKDFP